MKNPTHIDTTRAPKRKGRLGTPRAHLLPIPWAPKERTLERLANELWLTPQEVDDLYLPPFVAIATERRFLYRDWDAAFSNCVRQDWASIRTPATAGIEA